MVRNLATVSKLRHNYQDELETFTWSALVAVGIAIHDHKIYSKMSEHLFYYELVSDSKKEEDIF